MPQTDINRTMIDTDVPETKKIRSVPTIEQTDVDGANDDIKSTSSLVA